MLTNQLIDQTTATVRSKSKTNDYGTTGRGSQGKGIDGFLHSHQQQYNQQGTPGTLKHNKEKESFVMAQAWLKSLKGQQQQPLQQLQHKTMLEMKSNKRPKQKKVASKNQKLQLKIAHQKHDQEHDQKPNQLACLHALYLSQGAPQPKARSSFRRFKKRQIERARSL